MHAVVVFLLGLAFTGLIFPEAARADDFGERFGNTSPSALEQDTLDFGEIAPYDIEPAAGDAAPEEETAPSDSRVLRVYPQKLPFPVHGEEDKKPEKPADDAAIDLNL